MKGIELTKSQIKALENGATIFLLPLNLLEIGTEMMEYFCQDNYSMTLNEWFLSKTPIKKGEKFFVQENRYENIEGDFYFDTIKHKESDYNWYPSSQMTYNQSRFKDLKCIDVRVIRPFDLSIAEMYNIIGATYKFPNEEMIVERFSSFYNQQMQEQNINRTYDDNDYIFLAEAKVSK